jgi:hypothetical protein
MVISYIHIRLNNLDLGFWEPDPGHARKFCTAVFENKTALPSTDCVSEVRKKY